ncbi:MAG TPA: hypothetical protein VFT59_02890, partial [Candidatus Saccharimonadales bacterium]|nr:hypothetical protein [Candidatus Saccharimonadales bacterium]
MDEQDNNPTNTQGADEQMPANDTNSGMSNMSEDRQDTPAPNNGEGGESNVDNLPAGGEED